MIGKLTTWLIFLATLIYFISIWRGRIIANGLWAAMEISLSSHDTGYLGIKVQKTFDADMEDHMGPTHGDMWQTYGGQALKITWCHYFILESFCLV